MDSFEKHATPQLRCFPRAAQALRRIAEIGMFLAAPANADCLAGGEDTITIQGRALSTGLSEGVVMDGRGQVRLAESAGSGAFRTHGTHTISLDIPDADARVSVSPVGLEIPAVEASTRGRSQWPAAVCDVTVQIQFVLADGSSSAWEPCNLLSGGGFKDNDGNGVPDGVGVMRLRTGASTLVVGAMPAAACPANSWWRGQTVLYEGSMVETRDVPPGLPSALRLARATSDGQDTAEMLCDLAPPNTTLTVSGWNRYDIGEETSMGVMARFHEFDASGRRIGKYVMLGDDDFHQPSGAVPWRWRALTFTTTPVTVRLGIYPIRMIRAEGRAWAAGWEMRESSVFSPWGKGRLVLQETFEDPDAWEIDPAGAARFEPECDGNSVVLEPAPGTVAVLRRRIPVALQGGVLYAFRIDMANDVPGTYDLTHDTWVSCYLEFRNDEEAVLDAVKAMACRPDPAHPVGGAAIAPPGTTHGTFLLAASHKTYADSSRVNGTMKATFRRLQLEESGYDPQWRPRHKGVPIEEEVPPNATRMIIRARILSRDPAVTPSFEGYRIRFDES